MKKLFTLLLGAGIVFTVNAQALLTDNFAYTAGDSLTGNNWTQIGAVATNRIDVTSSGLSFGNFSGSGVGNAAALTTSGQDIYRDAPSAISSGGAYVSFMINVSAAQATGDYFLALLPNTSTSNFTARTYIKSSPLGFQFGISKGATSSDAPIYTSAEYLFGQTYFVVVKYNFATGTTSDDQISMYVFDATIPATEPASPLVGPTAGTATDAASLQRIALRQGNAGNSATLVIDGISLSDTWANIPFPIKFGSYNLSVVNNNVVINWETKFEQNVNEFSVERSANGTEFSTVGTVAATNKVEGSKYNFTDVNPIEGVSYYRIKSTDFDGKTSYTKTLVANTKKVSGIKLFGNPVRNNIVLSHDKAARGSVIRIYNSIGSLLQTINVQEGATQTSGDVSKLISGSYLAIFEANGVKQNVQFVKQ